MPIDYLLDGDIITEDWIASVAGLVEYGTYTPNLTNLNVGTTGTNVASYVWIGGTETGDWGLLSVECRQTWDGTGQVYPTNTSNWSLPSGFTVRGGTGATYYHGTVRISPGGGGTYTGDVWISSNVVSFHTRQVTGSHASLGSPDASTPNTWATGADLRYVLMCQAQRT